MANNPRWTPKTASMSSWSYCFKHGLLLGPVWGPSEDHTYYVKFAAMPTPAASAENNAV